MVDDTRLALNAPQTATYNDDDTNVGVVEEETSPGCEDDVLQDSVAADTSVASSTTSLNVQDPHNRNRSSSPKSSGSLPDRLALSAPQLPRSSRLITTERPHEFVAIDHKSYISIPTAEANDEKKVRPSLPPQLAIAAPVHIDEELDDDNDSGRVIDREVAREREANDEMYFATQNTQRRATTIAGNPSQGPLIGLPTVDSPPVASAAAAAAPASSPTHGSPSEVNIKKNRKRGSEDKHYQTEAGKNYPPQDQRISVIATAVQPYHEFDGHSSWPRGGGGGGRQPPPLPNVHRHLSDDGSQRGVDMVPAFPLPLPPNRRIHSEGLAANHGMNTVVPPPPRLVPETSKEVSLAPRPPAFSNVMVGITYMALTQAVTCQFVAKPQPTKP